MGTLHPDILDCIPMTRWYVAVVRNHWERSTKEKLDSLDLGIETYVPIQRVFRIYCDRRKWVDTVAIPGIVFIGIKDGTPISQIQQLPIPLRLLKTPDKKRHAVVPEHEFRRMRDFIERAEEEITLTDGLFAKGDVAHIFRGPFKGCEVKVTDDDDEKKVRIGIELTFLGRTISTRIAKTDLLSDVEWRRASRRIKESE